jgi:hypothetical protein
VPTPACAAPCACISVAPSLGGSPGGVPWP